MLLGCSLSLPPRRAGHSTRGGPDSRSIKVLEGAGGIEDTVIAPWPASADEVPASLRVAGYHRPPHHLSYCAQVAPFGFWTVLSTPVQLI